MLSYNMTRRWGEAGDCKYVTELLVLLTSTNTTGERYAVVTWRINWLDLTAQTCDAVSASCDVTHLISSIWRRPNNTCIAGLQKRTWTHGRLVNGVVVHLSVCLFVCLYVSVSVCVVVADRTHTLASTCRYIAWPGKSASHQRAVSQHVIARPLKWNCPSSM